MLTTYDARLEMERVSLAPGEYFGSNQSLAIHTVLGSCVGVCLRDPRTGVAGMNHFMLPAPLDTTMLFTSDAGRYGMNAMELLLNRLMQLGAERQRLVAKVFGGAHMLNIVTHTGSLPDSNVEFAMEYLRAERIPVLAHDVGGNQGRAVFFLTESGDVLVRKAGRHLVDKVTAEEEGWRSRL